jgi:hypothetical protein
MDDHWCNLNFSLQIYILLYKEVALALKINSVYSKTKLLSIHENVRVLRYPDHFSTGVYLWYALLDRLKQCQWEPNLSYLHDNEFFSFWYIFWLCLGPTMKSLSLLITRFALLEDWTCALVVMTLVNTEWVTALLKYGQERIIIIQGNLFFLYSRSVYFCGWICFSKCSSNYFLSEKVLNQCFLYAFWLF